VTLFTPALLFSKVAFTLSPAKLADLYIVPIGFVIITLVSVLVAWVLGLIFRLKPHQRAFAMACSMNGNSNSLPVALMQVRSDPSPPGTISNHRLTYAPVPY
jgi:auxin efflux carrier family protein